MNSNTARTLHALCIVFCFASSAYADEHTSSVAIVNDTGHAFADLFLSPSSSAEWGPDLLDAILADDETYSVVNIPCDQYDLMIVEDGGEQCLLPAIPLCGSDEVWKFTERTWRECVSMQTIATISP